jgi:hypothetical protein
MTMTRRTTRLFGGLAAALLLAAPVGCSSAGSGSAGTAGSGGGNTVGSGGTSGTTGVGGSASGGATGGSSISGSAGSGAGGNGAGDAGTSGGGGTGGAGGNGAGGTGTGGTSRGGAGGNAATGTGGNAGGRGGAAGSATGGTTSSGGAGPGGTGGTGAGGTGTAGTAGTAGMSGTTSLVSCPTLPGATASPLYSVTVNGAPLFVEQLTKFSPEMQVHYAHGSLAGTGTATIAVTVKQSFSAFTLSPKSRQLAATKSGNTITFNSGPNYLILKVDSLDLLFILLDAAETNPPKVGDANVKSIADYSVDSTGATLMTSKIQSAIDAASTSSTQNILYFPPGKYLVGELWMKSNVTMYLACGAVVYGSSNTGDFNTGAGGINIEGAQHALVRMYNIKNAKILGRGVLDSNGHYIRGQSLNANLLKIEGSSNILIDGIVSRDPSYWNTLVYRSDQVTIQNYKVVNCRPSAAGGYNQTDGVDFDESTNGKLTNAFLYTGDDGMAPKNEDPNGTINSKNITHQHIVVYNNSVGCKIGTKSMGQSMDTITFDDVDVVRAGRAMTIEAYDTAVVSNVTFSNIRVEAADSMLINLALDVPPTWRTAADTGVYKDIYFTNVSSDVKQVISLHGKSATVNINGVHFKNLTIQGKAVTSQTDADASWDINSYVSGITFQ